MFKLKEKNKICRKYSQDIWGNLIKFKKVNKVSIYLLQLKQEKKLRFQPFFLDILSRKPLKKRKVRSRFCKNLDTIKKLSLFSGGFRRKKLKQILTIASKNIKLFNERFFSLIELRLVLVLYRMNFCRSILEAMQFIYAGYVLVNKKIIKQINYVVKIGDLIELFYLKKEIYYIKWLNVLISKKYFLVQPHYLYINYEGLFSIPLDNLFPGFMIYPFIFFKQYGYMFQKLQL